MKLRFALAALLVSCTTALSAYAQQPWIEDRRLGEGAGIRTGNLELHPSLAGEFGYDSNYFQRADGENPVGSLRFRVTPSLTLATLGKERKAGDQPGASPPALNLNSGAFATYNAFVPLDDGNDFDNRRRLGGGVSLDLELFPRRVFSWDVGGRYLRIIDPSNAAGGASDFDRHTLSAQTGITFRPGGGLFDWRVGYRFIGTYFSDSGFDTQFDNNHHLIETRGRWRFLPRTAVIYDGEYRIIRYADNASLQQSGEAIQSRIGLNGLVTNRFAFRVMGGWAASFYDPDPVVGYQNYDGWVANAEVKWFLTPNPSLQPGSAQVGLSSIAAGYERDYANSYLGPFFSRDKGYLNFEYFIGGVAVVSLRGHVALVDYPTFATLASPEVNVSETRVGGRLFAEYRASEVVGINTTISYDRNVASGDNPVPLAMGGSDDLDFQRFQVFLGARLFW